MGAGVVTILIRELVAAARNAKMYQRRRGVAVGVLLGVAVGVYLAFPLGPGGWEVPARQVRRAAAFAFGGAVGMLATGTLLLIPWMLAAGIARERERGTLADLLTTRWTAFEIVGGKLASGLVRFGAWAASALPILVLLDRFGGTDVRLTLLAGTGLAGMAIFLAGLAVAVSVESRAERPAVGWAVAAGVVWLELPFLLSIFGPRLVPGLYRWIAPVNLVLVQSSPLAILGHLGGFMPQPSLAGAVFRAAAYQVVGGILLTAWAVYRLRPAARRLDFGGDPRTRRSRRPGRASTRPRPPCGDDPMDWKERYTSQPGTFARVLGVLAYLGGFAVLAYVTYFIARPAWQEHWGSASYRPVAVGDARWGFNQTYVRPLTGVFSVLMLLVGGGQCAEMLDREKSRGSWPVLLATPLTGREILRAKRGVILRRWRALLAMAGSVWLAGLAVGAVHPLGIALALATAYATVRFAAALGTLAAVRAARSDRPAGANLAAPALLVMVLAVFQPWALGGRPEAAWLGALSPLFLNVLAVLSPTEVAALLGRGPQGGVTILGILDRPGAAAWLVTSVGLGTGLLLALTRRLDREAERGFDAAVGRTDREGPPEREE
jgi:ABC-type Na+ efflux pump permease subunit